MEVFGRFQIKIKIVGNDFVVGKLPPKINSAGNVEVREAAASICTVETC